MAAGGQHLVAQCRVEVAELRRGQHPDVHDRAPGAVVEQVGARHDGHEVVDVGGVQHPRPLGQHGRRVGTPSDLVRRVVVEVNRRVVRGGSSLDRLDRWRPPHRAVADIGAAPEVQVHGRQALIAQLRLTGPIDRSRLHPVSQQQVLDGWHPVLEPPDLEPGTTGRQHRQREVAHPQRHRPGAAALVAGDRPGTAVDAGRCIARHGHVHPHRLVAAGSDRERRRAVAAPRRAAADPSRGRRTAPGRPGTRSTAPDGRTRPGCAG